MNKHHKIVIMGAGGIARAVALILTEWSTVTPTIFIGNRTLSKAQNFVKWIEDGLTRPCTLKSFPLSESGISKEMINVFKQGDILLDCLPGTEAPRMASYAKNYNLHYANLTEYVEETDKIKDIAKDASTGFILQTGLAPGYIDVLGNYLFEEFCNDFEVNTVDRLELKVGALTKNAVAPHFYGFTWSPVGVATEYLEEAEVIRNYKKTKLPSLSERDAIIINGITYEADLTSGGAADLPDALAGKVASMDYKTIRFPGHYAWVEEQIKNASDIKELQAVMESQVPHIEDDQIIIYAAVQGKDHKGILRRREIVKQILPQKIGKYQLRAIQTTTATPLIQSAQLLLETNIKGVLLQSKLDTRSFLNGGFITPVYGNV
ncbi:Saccharopine dehydrogenase C-terminal domain-containing protein [Zhouia amylolytica]|uniref:Saccharopine dehydrogenase C-terminal domain-containing protein n=1 Tax=Zhouia amylolytica TaxID=376730 RepID=A0A1I6RM48_9FLAO|nr:saccharopine dehydrogenase C-terminal domain-containing protein [Zhouia amylolytica]SFS65811.1 Saccharopine dehydrogenase C-terminal domain-containing protein [Zhouia amylolytica]